MKMTGNPKEFGLNFELAGSSSYPSLSYQRSTVIRAMFLYRHTLG